MENYPIKSVTFGGFDKQDVIRYIEQTAKSNEVIQRELTEETERLRAQVEELTAANTALRIENDALLSKKEVLEAELAMEAAHAKEMEALKGADEKVAELEAEIARLRPDAANYAQFRDRLGAIECEARERADALERSTTEQLQKTVEDFRSQYTTLMSTFESTASYVTVELRKVEVNLTQLPRAMDRAGVELGELAKRLDGKEE